MSRADELADVFRYDETTGALFWAVSAGNGRKRAGDKAGCFTTCGGIKVTYKRKSYWAHHIVWLMHRGELPTTFVDHINGNRSDNRIENLRLCNQSQNMQNLSRKSVGAHGLRGVHRYRKGKWASAIINQGKKTWLGVFRTPDEAHQAYLNAKRELHTFNPELRS